MTITRAIEGLCLLGLLAGCGGDAVFDVEIEPGSMSVDVSGESVSDAESFTWTNGGERAEVSMSMSDSATGEVVLRVRDDAGTRVFDESIRDGGGFEALTDPNGAPGAWEVVVRTNGLDGSASISLDRYSD